MEKILLRKMDKYAKLKIINWNANGIRTKINELEELLNRLGIDLCLITETKLNKKMNNVNVKNYNIYRLDRNTNVAGGGVAILVNKKYGNVKKINGRQ